MSFKADIPTLSANEVYTLTFEYEGTETIQLIVGDLTLETTDRRVVFTTASPVNYIESNVNLTNLNMYEGYYESDDQGGEYTQESYIEGKTEITDNVVKCVKSPKIVSRNEDGTEESIITTPDDLELYELDGIFDKLDLTNGIVTKYIGNNDGSLYLLDTPTTEQISINPLKSYRNGSIQTSSQQLVPTLKTTLPISNKFTTTNLTSGSTYNVYFDGTVTKLDAGGTIITNPISPCEVECGGTTLTIEGTDIQNVRVIETSVKNEVGSVCGTTDVELSRIITSELEVITNGIEFSSDSGNGNKNTVDNKLGTINTKGSHTWGVGIFASNKTYPKGFSLLHIEFDVDMPSDNLMAIINFNNNVGNNLYNFRDLTLDNDTATIAQGQTTGVGPKYSSIVTKGHFSRLIYCFSSQGTIQLNINTGLGAMISSSGNSAEGSTSGYTACASNGVTISNFKIKVIENYPDATASAHITSSLRTDNGLTIIWQDMDMSICQSMSILERPIKLRSLGTTHDSYNPVTGELTKRIGVSETDGSYSVLSSSIISQVKINNIPQVYKDGIIKIHSDSNIYPMTTFEIPTTNKYDISTWETGVYTQRNIAEIYFNDSTTPMIPTETLTFTKNHLLNGRIVIIGESPMLIKGDYTGRDIPYFTGMRSVEAIEVETSNSDSSIQSTIQLPPHIQLHSLPDGTRDEVDIKTGILTRRTQKVNDEIIALETPTTEQLILNYNNSCGYGRILPTGMCDKYDIVNSIYTQTMTSILLDGENVWDAIEEFENTVKFTATGTTVGVEELNMLGAGGLYCDNDLFPNINDDSDVEHCRVDEAGDKFYIYISKDRLMSPDLIGYQIWLQENNFNLIYELAEHITYSKPYKELDATQARWEGMDCIRDGVIKYHTNSSDNITIYPTLEYVAPSINNFEVPMLEPNTDYTIYAEGINTNDTINLGGNDINFNNGTVSTSGDNQWLRIDNNDSLYNMVIIKGDTTGEVVPYFEGMTSVENPKVQCGESTISYTDLKLRSLPNGVKDTINVVTGEYVQRVGEREYQVGDLENENVLTDSIHTMYELTDPIITKLDAQTLLAYTNETINLSSDTGLLPTIHYTVPSTNTFHLPSMKTGTLYTLKYPSASGSITIGDINYNIYSDSMLFTTPLKINRDKPAIVFSDTNPENVMLLEGAYNKREVPFFTGIKSVKNPNITIIDQLSTESTTYNCETEIELRGLPNGVADKLDIIKGKLTTNVGIRPYQEGDENLPNIWTDGYETVYALNSPIVTNVNIDRPTVTANSLIELSSDYLIPQLNYRAISSNNFPLDLLQPNTTYTLYADTLISGSYTLGGTKTGVYSQPHTFTLGDTTDNLLTFNGDLGLSNVMLVKGNSLKTTLPPYFLGIRSVTDGHLLVEGMAGEINELTFDKDIVLRDCNGIKDTIDLITCTLTKRTGEIMLTGAEEWSILPNATINDDLQIFTLTLSGINSSINNGLVCDKFIHRHMSGKLQDTEAIYSTNNQLILVVKKSRIGGDTVNALKSWLNQNPTTVIYPLITQLEILLENVWTTTPLTSYNNQTEISSTVSSTSLKPMISVTIATTTFEQIVSDLEAQNEELKNENVATMLALTNIYETFAIPMAVNETSTIDLSDGKDGNKVNGMSVSPMSMIYAKLIKKGYKTIEQVPTNLQAEVKYVLKGLE